MTQKANYDFEASTVIKATVIAGAVIGAAMFLLSDDGPSLLMGLVFGMVFSILNFRLLQLTIKKSMSMPASKAQAYVTSRYFVRYLLAGAVLYVSINNETMNVLGTVIGLLLIKFVIFILNIYTGIKK
ncbi:ATP synthase subunit I [Alkalibacter mobilis]|uniref:ATP synthase subunit I n=1 Tax=Alkalibacter mobilis TaxID=2787712 RepID=UPI00189EB6B7|nr:ATP synthase subunit I [Alkalibacter mobilis]MBF7096160.1 ATP synthase subunit I [Alkalibacter mobilis]